MSSNNSSISAPADDLFLDSVNLVSSTTTTSTAYGAMLTLYFICLYFLKLKTHIEHERRRSIILICYITLMFIMGTTYVVTTTQATVVSYVYHSSFPGGPSFYNNLVLFSAPVGIINTISYVVTNWMADGLLLWRFLVLFRGSSYSTVATAFPALIYLGSFAMGLLFIVQTSLPNGSLWANGELNFALPYFVLSVSMSIITTMLMIVRMLLFKRKMQAILGKHHTSPYTSISTILVESCALYAIFSIIFIILFALNHPIQLVFLSCLANVQIIATLLVIFQVSQNKAWDRKTTESTLSSLKFGSMGQNADAPNPLIKMMDLHDTGEYPTYISKGSHKTVAHEEAKSEELK